MINDEGSNAMMSDFISARENNLDDDMVGRVITFSYHKIKSQIVI
jgi:hypothetical protein